MFKKKVFNFVIASFLVAGVVIGGGVVTNKISAGSSGIYGNYWTVVPGFGGDGFTGKIQKQTIMDTARNENSSTGGDFNLWSTIMFGNSEVSPETFVPPGGAANIYFNRGMNTVGNNYYLMIETSAFNKTSCETGGRWTPN